MGSRADFGGYLTRTGFATIVFTGGKTMHSALLNLVATREFLKFIFGTGNYTPIQQAVYNTAIIAAIAGGLSVNATVNTPSFYEEFKKRFDKNPLDIQLGIDELKPVTSLAETFISFPIKVAIWTYGIMTSLLGYFLIHQLSEVIAAATNTDPYDSAWKNILIDTLGLIVSLIVFLKYATYDAPNSGRFGEEIARGIVNRKIPMNKAMLGTSLVATISLTIAPMQAYFFAKPAFEAAPGIGDIALMVKILTLFSCGGTALTVSSWMVAVYNALNAAFSAKTGDHLLSADSAVPADNSNTDTKQRVANMLIKTGSYSGALLDASTQGLSAFMGLVAIVESISGEDPHRAWIMTLATIGLLNTIVTHFSFLKPGIDKTCGKLSTLFQPKQTAAEIYAESLSRLEEGFVDLSTGQPVSAARAAASHPIDIIRSNSSVDSTPASASTSLLTDAINAHQASSSAPRYGTFSTSV